MSLTGLAHIVTGKATSTHPKQTQVKAVDENLDRREALKRWGTLVVMFSLMTGCLIPVAIGLQSFAPIFKALILVLAGIAGLLLFGGSSLIVYGDMLPKTQENKQPVQPGVLKEASITTELAPAQPYNLVPGVTEQPTHHLVVPVKQ